MHPVPIVHGMTIGEYAKMINGEGWLSEGVKCDLTIIPVKNWDHSQSYSLPLKPSPNLPDDLSISLYPSLCLFEGTIMSVGRGTDKAFQQIGHLNFRILPILLFQNHGEGSKWPPFEDEICYGISWTGTQPQYQLSLATLIDTYQKMIEMISSMTTSSVWLELTSCKCKSNKE